MSLEVQGYGTGKAGRRVGIIHKYGTNREGRPALLLAARFWLIPDLDTHRRSIALPAIPRPEGCRWQKKCHSEILFLMQ
jgi:hypothetical protein